LSRGLKKKTTLCRQGLTNQPSPHRIVPATPSPSSSCVRSEALAAPEKSHAEPHLFQPCPRFRGRFSAQMGVPLVRGLSRGRKIDYTGPRLPDRTTRKLNGPWIVTQQHSCKRHASAYVFRFRAQPGANRRPPTDPWALLVAPCPAQVGAQRAHLVANPPMGTGR
jgi:hypothetical protein